MKKTVLVGLAVIVLAVLVTGANLAQIAMINHVISRNAERTALNWVSFLTENTPATVEILRTGFVTPDQQTKLALANLVGEVFKFKIFDQDAQLVMVSDGPVPQTTANTEVDADAQSVLKTGENVIYYENGNETDGRPDVYVEAYVPVTDSDGNRIGVAEVYVDQSEAAAISYDASNKLALGLSTVFTLVMSLLYIAYQIKKNQESRSRRQVDFLARHDQLSRLHNRAGLEEALETLHFKKELRPENTAVIYLDIDHFKLINDTYGHKAGDAVLGALGEAIIESLGPRDVASRFGGDEFVIVAQCADLEAALGLTEQLRALVSKPVRIDGAAITTNLSMGLHYGGAPDQLMNERIHRADLALYQAKMDGRNTTRVFTPELEQSVQRRRKVENAVVTGLANDLFSIHYQPLIDQASLRCVGFEALLRLTDTDGESINADEFIPVAEATGVIRPLGTWVLVNAIKAAVDWPEELSISVNLSARQFDDGHLVDTVKDALKSNGLAPSRLELEVTESLLMENTEKVGSQLKELRDLGISIAMDDFGTGYSSLGYLWQFGFDKLKIDRSFISGLDHDDPKAREILDTIVMLGHRLDMVVTAEGIENQKQASIISELACDQMQGFLYGRPMKHVDVAAYVLDNFRKSVPDGKKAEGNLTQTIEPLQSLQSGL